ncbi:hypothetical protein [Streptomyces cacaoi]|uniref:hypothetical protein n=1 Tax=Streptomyces cacaoi TaxID=1898 RepID=UPI000A364A82|nr:hypothetical protein [Streptomyces cacaoi]
MTDRTTSASRPPERHDDRAELARLLPAPADVELPREQHLRHKELLMHEIDREQTQSARPARRLLRPALLAPATALAAALPRLDPLSRTVVALVGALAVDLLTAQLMLATHAWSARGGVVAVGALSLAGLAARAIGAGGTRGAGGTVRAAGGTADGTGGPGAAGPYEAPGAPAPVPGGEEGGGDRLESPGVRRDG